MVKQQVPSWAKKYLKPDAFVEVLAAVMNAETKTSAELVPMVVKRSAFPPNRVRDTAIWLSAAAVVGVSSQLPWWVAVVAALPALVPWVFPDWELRWANAPDRLDAEVQRRAQLEFYQAGLTETAGKTGILLFVSLAEHRVVVLADKAIADKLPPDTWQGVVSTIIASIKSGDLTRGLATALGDCAKLLAPHFPKAGDDKNELKDLLIVKE